MTEKIIAQMRWYPGDALVPIDKSYLDTLAKQHRVTVSVENVEGKSRRMAEGILREDTQAESLEEVTQTVVTVSGRDEVAFRHVIRAIIGKYRAPRTTYATWGRTTEGKRIVEELSDEDDGWT